jgi:RNA polymerase sigma-70 factor, ECF subfamily
VEGVQPDSEATRKLLEQVRAGDQRAFELLFTLYRAELRRFIGLRLDPKLRARVDASDVVQETQIDAFRRLADFLERRPMPFRLWLRKTAYDRLLKIRRHHVGTAQRTVEREASLPKGSSVSLGRQLVAGGSTPSQRLDRDLMARRVRQAVAQLPDSDREVLIMRNFDGLSNVEVACILGIDPDAARKRHGRALLKLRRQLLDSGLRESEL